MQFYVRYNLRGAVLPIWIFVLVTGAFVSSFAGFSRVLDSAKPETALTVLGSILLVVIITMGTSAVLAFTKENTIKSRGGMAFHAVLIGTGYGACAAILNAIGPYFFR